MHRTSTLVTRSSQSQPHLRTAHGDVGLALEVALLLLAPIILLRSFLARPSRAPGEALGPAVAPEKPEEYFPQPNNAPEPSTPQRAQPVPSGDQPPHPPAEAAPQVERRSSDTEDSLSHGHSSSGVRSFEVTNRPSAHLRHSTSNSLTAFAEFAGFTRQQSAPPAHATPRTLGDVDWLERRRSLMAVDELDYALTQLRKTPGPATPATMPVDSQVHIVSHDVVKSRHTASRPSVIDIVLHSLLHALILALAAFTLHAVWTRATSRAAFGVFLAWIIVFYFLLFTFTWYTRPPRSTLAYLFNQSHPPIPPPSAQPEPADIPAAVPSPQTTESRLPASTGNNSPYIHQPPHRSTFLAPQEDDLTSTSQARPRSHDGYYGDDEDEDDETRQSRIEAELNRRQVAIVTVPRQRLFIANAT